MNNTALNIENANSPMSEKEFEQKIETDWKRAIS